MAYGWSGFGEARVVIGDDGQPRVVTDGPINTVTVTPSGSTYQDAAGNVIPLANAQSSDIVGWLNENSGKLAIGAACFFGLMFAAKAMR